MGFYQDNWPHLYYGRVLGLSQVLDLYRYTTRPPGTLLYVTGFAALGYTPLYWQILSLAIRFFTCLFLWLTLRSLWVQHKRFAAWTTLLFAVYPLFRLQPLAVTYFYHWSGYLLFLISLWAMIQSLRQPRRFWLYYALSLGHLPGAHVPDGIFPRSGADPPADLVAAAGGKTRAQRRPVEKAIKYYGRRTCWG